jgi:hypothetical protein
MKIIIIIFTTLIFTTSKAQLKVANYSTGKYGTETYEHISFWIEDGKKSYLEYAYGKEPTEIKLLFLGQKILNRNKSIKVQFSNGNILFITPDGLNLNVSDENGKYFKTFKWEYVGPINGIGTYCDICAENEKEAMKMVKNNYLH